MSRKTNIPRRSSDESAEEEAESAYDLKLEDAPPVERHDIVIPAQTFPLTDEELAVLLIPSPTDESVSASQTRSASSDDAGVPPPPSSDANEDTSSSSPLEPEQTQPRTLSSRSTVSDQDPVAGSAFVETPLDPVEQVSAAAPNQSDGISGFVAPSQETALSGGGSSSTTSVLEDPLPDIHPIGVLVDSDASANAVDENVIAGTSVGITAQASDADGSDTVSYSLSNDAGGLFAIDTKRNAAIQCSAPSLA